MEGVKPVSWTLSLPATDLVNFGESLRYQAVRKEEEIKGYANWSVEMQLASIDQMLAAVYAAIELANSTKVGNRLSVSMTGHANPDHAPMQGWGDDFVTVTLSFQRLPPSGTTQG